MAAPAASSGLASILEATRTQSAISDGVNAIIVDDVQLSAIVRLDGEALLRYRQVISVGQQCTAVRGHPCAYPTADFRTVSSDGSDTGRTSSCQSEAAHGGKWYDTDANITSLKPSSPFQVLVDAFYTGVVAEGESAPAPSHLHSFRGLSVRAVHSACDVGEPGYCPQVSGAVRPSPLPPILLSRLAPRCSRALRQTHALAPLRRYRTKTRSARRPCHSRHLASRGPCPALESWPAIWRLASTAPRPSRVSR